MKIVTSWRVAVRVKWINLHSMPITGLEFPTKPRADTGVWLPNSVPLLPGDTARERVPGSRRCGHMIKIWPWNVRKNVLHLPHPGSAHETFYVFSPRAAFISWNWQNLRIWIPKWLHEVLADNEEHLIWTLYKQDINLYQCGFRVYLLQQLALLESKLKARRLPWAVQWLRFCIPNAGGPGSIPGRGTRSHMPQLGVRKSWLKILHATTNTQHRQINTFLF